MADALSCSSFGGRNGHLWKAFAKEWDPRFSGEWKLDEDKPFAEKLDFFHAVGEDINFFLKSTEESSYRVDVEEISWACRDARLDHLADGVGAARERQSAWVNDMMRSKGSVRRDKDSSSTGSQWHFATELYNLLKKPRFGLPGMPDADRRLIVVISRTWTLITSLPFSRPCPSISGQH